uniref:Uncharacterized protein n=1 Tax=Anguilla anguilla TaxID=7936 RepID=A0A0E9S3Z1_ANGAN
MLHPFPTRFRIPNYSSAHADISFDAVECSQAFTLL